MFFFVWRLDHSFRFSALTCVTASRLAISRFSGVGPGAKNRRANTHRCRALADGILKIRAHPHTQFQSQRIQPYSGGGLPTTSVERLEILYAATTIVGSANCHEPSQLERWTLFRN